MGSLTYNSNNQKSGTGYSYDGNGNPTTYAGTSLGFDLESCLTAIGSSWSAGYRPDGLRGSKTVGSTTTYFLYDGATPVAELNSSGTITALNVFGADCLIGRVVPGGTDIQYLFDHQGNVAQRLDGSGSVVSKSTYDAYGAESSTSTPTDPFGYNAQSGYYLDRETGLYLCTYRYYDPAKGRWLNRDPISYAGGMNLYGYCGGGPVGGLDALGLQGDNVHKGAALADALSDGTGTAIENLAGGESWDVAPGIVSQINGTAATTIPTWLGPAAKAAAVLGATALSATLPEPRSTQEACDDIAPTNENIVLRSLEMSEDKDYGPLAPLKQEIEQIVGLSIIKNECDKRYKRAIKRILRMKRDGWLGTGKVLKYNLRMLYDAASAQYSRCLSGAI